MLVCDKNTPAKAARPRRGLAHLGDGSQQARCLRCALPFIGFFQPLAFVPIIGGPLRLRPRSPLAIFCIRLDLAIFLRSVLVLSLWQGTQRTWQFSRSLRPSKKSGLM